MARNWYYAKVIDSNDPLNLGRVRAEILTAFASETSVQCGSWSGVRSLIIPLSSPLEIKLC
jgi:hypothetical protein